MPPSPSFGVLLGQHLEHFGLTNREFAQRAGVSHTYVNLIVSGTRRPAKRRIALWAGLLGLAGEQREAFIHAGLLLHTPPEFHGQLTREGGSRSFLPESRVAELPVEASQTPVRQRKNRKPLRIRTQP